MTRMKTLRNNGIINKSKALPFTNQDEIFYLNG
jgi:hypothetical protein